MRYPLEDLLEIRRVRQDRAQNEVVRKRHETDRANRKVEDRKREAADYRRWRLRKEDELYEEIRGKIVPLGELDDLKETVSGLRRREAALEKAVEEALEELEAAREELEKARERYREAVREARKIDEHKASWMEEALKERREAQEKEMEDFQLRSRDSEDDEPDDWLDGH